MKIIFMLVTQCPGNEVRLVSTTQMFPVSARGGWNVCLFVTANQNKCF